MFIRVVFCLLSSIALSIPLISCASTSSINWYSIEIGDSKREVIMKLAQAEISEVKPSVEKKYVIKQNNIDDLYVLFDSKGVVVELAEKYKIYIEVESNKVSKVYIPPKYRNNIVPIKVGSNNQVLLSFLQKVIKENENAIVYNYLPNTLGVSPVSSSEEQLKYITSFDCWTFFEPNGYSSYKLLFRNNKLDKKDFFYSPFELP